MYLDLHCRCCLELYEVRYSAGQKRDSEYCAACRQGCILKPNARTGQRVPCRRKVSP